MNIEQLIWATFGVLNGLSGGICLYELRRLNWLIELGKAEFKLDRNWLAVFAIVYGGAGVIVGHLHAAEYIGSFMFLMSCSVAAVLLLAFTIACSNSVNKRLAKII